MGQLSLLTAQKLCRKCGAVKPLSGFSRNQNTRDGLQTQCKACNRAYYEAHREYVAARDAARRLAFPELFRERNIAKYWRDVEASRALGRANAAVQNAKPERKAAKREWARRDRAVNPEKWREMDRQQYRRNPTYYQEIQWRRRAQKLATMVGPVTVALLEAKRAYWGNRCWLCGGEATEMDHVKPLTKGGAHMLCNLRPACRSCNARKRDTWPLAA